jgi:two-component system sensor histidine kinase ChvG
MTIMGEGARLERVIDNLIDNAVSFSPPEGTIEVGARIEEGWLILTVDDEGPGVPEDARSSIFRRFHTVRPGHEDFGRHSGLGLAIARTIVEGHGGEIDVESRGDRVKGARFVIRLPLAEQP